MTLLDIEKAGQGSEPWFVAHTKPRTEKQLAAFCQKEGIFCVLPCYESVRKYIRKTVLFRKPLFANYLFVRLTPLQRRTLARNRYVVNVLDVHDQEQFEAQLQQIMTALDTPREVVLAPQISEGKQVRVKSGPLRGLEGFVQSRLGVDWVVLRLDFIGSGAAVKIEANELELG